MLTKIKHINYPIVAEAHTPMFLMHKYWARKPHNVIEEYIKHYSKEGEIVLDPFSGSGVTPIEAIKCGRKAIGIDLNPIANFITKQTAVPVDIGVLKKTFLIIENVCKKQIEALYETKCKRCKAEISALVIIWDRDKKTPTEIRYFCPLCKKRISKTLDQDDKTLLKSIKRRKIPFWYPRDRFPSGDTFDQGKREAGDYFSDLFTKRNLISLSILYNSIEKIKDRKIQDLFKFSFTSMVHLASKMTPVRPSRPYSSFWAMPSYWVPPIYMESNVWNLFDSAINGKQGLIKGKEDSNAQIQYYKEARNFNELKNKANIFIKDFNALELSKIIPPNTIDYIFTDPPYGGSIPYFELSTLWLLWLRGSHKENKFELKFKEEITISKHQEKDFDYYHKMLVATFGEMNKVLRPGRWLTVTFHNKEIKVWNSIIRAVLLAGFNLDKIIYQPPPRASSAGLLRPYGSAVGDYYIRFCKPKLKKLILSPSKVSEKRYERVAVETAKKIIAERGEPTPYQYILNGVIPELDRNGVLLKGTTDIGDVMQKQLGKEFLLVDELDENNKVIGKKWWLKDISKIKINLVPLYERVEKAVINVLNRKIVATFDDIQKEIFITFPNALTPEKESIRAVLREYASPEKGGRWILRPSVQARLKEHPRIIYYLAKMGVKAGCDIWIGTNEQGQKYEGKRLGDLSTKQLKLARKLSRERLGRIKTIDVLWLKKGKIIAVFEVENSTTITDAVVRADNIPYETYKVILIPNERESLLARKIQEPGLQKLGIKSWKFIFYDDFSDFYNKHKKKDRISLKELFKLSRSVKIRETQQTSLGFFPRQETK